MNTLFWDTPLAVQSFDSRFRVAVSPQFIDCADAQLTASFTKQTGIKAGKNAVFSISSNGVDAPLPYVKDIISGIGITLYINDNWNPITILWKSKSGRIYNLDDADIDGNDIEFWFDHLDVALYQKQFYPKAKLPFELKGLSFELIVTRINMDCTLVLNLDENAVRNADRIIEQLHQFIENWNQQSKEKSRHNGVVHNSKGWIENKHTIVYEMDLGSTGKIFMKELLNFLSNLKAFTKVEIR